MDFFEAGMLDMGVDLRSGNAGMTQHHLDRSQICPMIQEVGGERMAQHMRGYRFGNPSSNRAILENFPKTLPAHGPTQPGEK